MQYNRLNGIVQKALQYTLNGQDKGYTLDYEYNNPKHPHAPSLIANSQSPKARNYQYDGNGNPTYYDEFKGFRGMVWDEENRLRGINDNGRLHLYTYDHTGERVLKSSAESSMAVINGLASAVITHTEDYTAYVSPYFVVQKGKFTKHYFEGATRIVSKLGEGTFSHKNTGIMAGGLDYLKRTQKEQEARDRYIKGLNVPPGPPTQHGIYTTPEWTGQPYPSIDWEAISQNQEPPEGWPRYPRFNEPGDVPGPPVQFGEAITNANVKAGHGFIPNGVEEKNLYFYHPDHLGSSSYITDKNGEVIQHTEYMAFGEVFVDEHSTTNKMPYLFNGKELDYETGLYYYGARYYDAKTSLWLNTDPLSGYNPIQEVEHYIDGQHNGGIFNPMNMATYSYTYQNPILYIDPNGKQGIPGILLGALTEYGSIIGEKMMFENKSFSQANNELTLGDGINIGIAGATGAVSGIAKFAKWVASPTGRKILVKMFEVGIDVVEDIVKQNVKSIIDNEEVDLKQTVVSTLTNLGMGKLLKGTSLEKHIAKQEEIVEKAQKEITNIKNSNVGTKGGQAKKIRTQNAIINNAQKKIKTYDNVNKAVNKTVTAGASTVTTGIYKHNKE